MGWCPGPLYGIDAPKAGLIFDHDDNWTGVISRPILAYRMDLDRKRVPSLVLHGWIGFGMLRTGRNVAPVVPMHQLIDCAEMDRGTTRSAKVC